MERVKSWFSRWPLLLTLFLTPISMAQEPRPMDAAAYYNRGITYERKGQYDQAISDYSKALEINPALAVAHYNRAVTYYYLKDYDKA